MKITYSTITKIGRRSINQDAFNVIDKADKERWMGIVCDGMGGHALGDVASETVVKTITGYWENHMAIPDTEEKVMEAIRQSSDAIDERSTFFNHCEMGTTMVMACIEGNKVTIAHIGDSRCYLMRPGHYDYDDINNTDKDNVVYQTKDHVRLDFGWDVVAKCFFSFRPEVAVPDIVQFEIQPGDRIFLCSDGLYKCIPPYILKNRLMDDKTPDEILDVFDFLCGRSGDDNYTAIMVRVD